MSSMGRRPTKNTNLPPRMRARARPSGVYYYYDTGARPRKEIALGSDYTIAVRKWAELEGTGNAITSSLITLKAVWNRYLKEVLPGKAVRTQKDNLAEIDNLLAFFGADAPIEAIEPIHVRQFLTHRKDAPVRANREKALLSHIFNMAREWGLTSRSNPCQGVKNYKETGRDIYIEDEVFAAVYESACQPIMDAMDLAYLTGQRVADTLLMSELDIKDGAILVQQGKTDKKLRMIIEGELDALLKRIATRKAGYKVRTMMLICNERGMPLRLKAMQARFQRIRQKAAKKHPNLAEEIERFQFRDLRAKAGTDKLENTGNIVEAQRMLGHSNTVMTEHYIRNRRGETVKPTR